MSSILSSFVQAPSEVALELCTKEQLIEIADHYQIEIADKKLKETVKARLKQGLREEGVLRGQSLTFEQQRELQMQLEIARLRNVNGPEGVPQFDVSQNLRLLPKFDESDPDTYLTLFERIAGARVWSDSDMTMLLQCVLSGKAREAFSALSVADSKVYAKVKSAVLKIYELVPEAYRQRFRYREKLDSQTYSEFVRDLTSAFNCWCRASEVSTFEGLSNLIVLEQFKDSVSDQVATYINERKVKSPSDAAVLADEYRLTHKSHFESNSDMHYKNNFTPRYSRSSFSGALFQRPQQKFGSGGPKAPVNANTCRYCLVEGHWKKDCPLLKLKKLDQVKPAVMAVPVTASDHQVSLVDGNQNVPIKILRDTGALDSFLVESVLPFSKESDTGSCVLIRGMGLVPFVSPLHDVTLKCGLVEGDVAVGVRPQLPVEGVHMILGNDLAGSKVWADGKINIFKNQGVLERFHQTLKSLLRSYCTELSADWEEGLPWLLLAAREVVQESTGFSPNDLVFGHKVRGPLAVLQDGCLPEEPPRNLIDYVNGFRLKLYRAGELAKDKLKYSQMKMKLRYDGQAELRKFSSGDRVLALLPLVSSPFQAKYCGPFTVLRKVSDLNYLIETPGRRKSSKLCHVNLLKCYHSHDQSKDDGTPVVRSALIAAPVTASCGFNFVEGDEEEDVRVSDEVLQGRLKNSQTLQNLGVLVDHLDSEKRDEVVALIRNYPGLFSDTPSQMHLIEHDIDIGDAKPIKQRFYRVSEEKRLQLETEVQYMLDNGIAEPCC
uniref:CCHC-type domain-containing protein n=1 Tax=Sander lucioperca TaxID=283035 RepID=A0A8D0AC21_SANLU